MPSADPAKEGLNVTVNSSDSTSAAIAYYASNGSVCNPGEFQVETARVVSTASGSPAGEASTDEGFFFSAP